MKYKDLSSPLPEPYTRQWINCPFTERLLFTADQMRAYALQEVAAERERWESVIGEVMPSDFKCWHKNDTRERPEIAAWVIQNLCEQLDQTMGISK